MEHFRWTMQERSLKAPALFDRQRQANHSGGRQQFVWIDNTWGNKRSQATGH